MVPEGPDLYTDAVRIQVSGFGVLLSCGLQPYGAAAGNVVPTPVCNIRMSLEHAKVLAILLRKQLRAFEANQGAEVLLHPDMAKGLGISKQEDW